MSLAQARNVGSVGYIVSYSIFAAAIQKVFGVPWSSCQKLSTRHTNALCEELEEQTQNLRTDCFSASPSLPGRSVSRNWWSFSHFKTELIPKFRDDWRLEDPLGAMLSTRSTLLSLVNVDVFAAIQFSYFLIEEFLTSSRFSEKHDPISCRYHLSMKPAHTIVA